MPGVRLAEFECAYHDAGAGATWTFLHPACLDHRTWNGLAALAVDRRMLAPDLRGHGASSSGPRCAFTLSRFAADVVELWDALGVERSVVVGASLGGMVAQYLAHEYPERVAGLALVCTSFGLDDAGREVMARRAEAALAIREHGSPEVDATLVRWFGDDPGRWPEAVDYARDRLCATPPEVQGDVWRAIRGLGLPEGWLRHYPGEVLVLPGGADVTIGVDAARRFASNSPRADVRVLNGAPHMALLTHPDDVAAALADLAMRLGEVG